MNPGLAGFRANKNPDLSHSGIWKMTKRDSQAREYAAESKGKPMPDNTALTPEEKDAVRFFATYGAPAHRANTLRKLLERLQ